LIAALLVVALALLVLGRRRSPLLRRSRGVSAPGIDRVALLAPVAGYEPLLDRFLAALLALDPAPDVLVLIIEEHRLGDPSARRVNEWEQSGLPSHVRIVRAPRATQSSQKAESLRAGLDAVPDADVIVTVDSDTLPQPSFIGALLSGLRQRDASVATGYRWFVPDWRPVSQLMALWNGAALAVLEDPGRAFAWGGATAIRRQELESLGVVRRWRRALSTDMAITRAVRAAEGRIHFVPGAVVPTVERCDWSGCARWIVRQLVMFHRSDPRQGRLIFAYHALLAATQVGALAVLAGSGTLAWLPRIVVVALILAPSVRGMWRVRQRFRRLRSEPIAQTPGWDRGAWLQVFLSPLLPWIMLAGLLASHCVRQVEWRGVRYGIGPDNTAASVDWSGVQPDTQQISPNA
jgi:cellulose synthase/poly-beta-1,6-N-acetylglucosamine synthase-like glycosyltransferase